MTTCVTALDEPGGLLIFAAACPQGGCASVTSLLASLHAGWYVQSDPADRPRRVGCHSREPGTPAEGRLSALKQIRSQLVEGTNSVGERYRARRWDLLRATFPEIESMTVLDLGGRPGMWLRAPFQPTFIHIVNLQAPPPEFPDWMRVDQGDACALGPEVAGNSYDLVFSNSVLEHVGGHAQRARFAANVRELGPRYWVQTPYRYFPLEPHWLFPGFQFFPLNVRAEISRRWPLVHFPPENRTASIRRVMEIELVSKTEMCAYFPDSTLLSEKTSGLTKSLIAVKQLESDVALN